MKNKPNNFLIPTSQVLDRIMIENPWWKTGAIDQDYDRMPRRLYFEKLTPLVTDLDLKRAIILMGPRRVGKTVMMRHTISKLLSEGVRPESINVNGSA